MPQIDLRNWGKGRPDTPAAPTSTPSKEQFEAAAQKVMQTAPPGLSREDFFNLIEQELAPKVSGHDLLTHAGMALDSPVDETGKPTQGDSPFLSKLKGMMSDAAAPPTSLLDLAKKISLFTLPSAGSVGSYSGVGGDLIPDTIGRARAATKAAVGETSGVGSTLGLPLRIVGKFKNALPTSNIDRVEKFRGGPAPAPVTPPNLGPSGLDFLDVAKSNHPPVELREMLGDAVSAPPSAANPGASGSDLYGLAKSNHPPATPPPLRLNKAGGKQSLEDLIADVMNPEKLTKYDSQGMELPPQLETAGEGPLKQSGKFGKSGNLGQAGGYTSGRPGITEAQQDELLKKFGGGGGGPEPPTRPPGGDVITPPSSKFPPEGGQGDWHSGAEPGSEEAAMANRLHPETRELDNLYTRKINDPLAALLMSLGVGAGAYGAQK